jgi:hypothetical protein
MPTPALAAPAVVSKESPWIVGFRYLRWSVYLAAFITLILLLHKPTPPKIQVSTQAAERAEEKVVQVEDAASRGEPATLRLDESELNSYLASHLNTAQAANAVRGTAPASSPAPPTTEVSNSVPAPAASLAGDAVSAAETSEKMSDAEIEQTRSSVRDVKVQMEGDRVHAYVIFDVHGKDMSLELVGKLGSSDGYLKFEPISGQLGSLPIPQSTLEGAVERLMDSPQNREKLRLPSDIEEMHIENGELVATYH